MIDDRRAALVERLEDAAGYASKEHAAIMREAAADLDLIRAEVDRLRAALTEIRDAGPMTLDDQRWRIALAALGGEND